MGEIQSENQDLILDLNLEQKLNAAYSERAMINLRYNSFMIPIPPLPTMRKQNKQTNKPIK